MHELQLIAKLKTLCPSNESIILGIDDDAAILRPTLRATLVCADMLMDGVHFQIDEAGPQAIGHKALAVNLSDIAAMGGKALSAFVSLALPRRLANESFIIDFYRGMSRLANEFGVAIAGGDTNIWDGPLVVNVTVVGEAHTKGAVKRSGAQVGDTIFVTGALGGSIHAHHLVFQPRLAEARALMDAFTLHSMTDISDGLAKDLRTVTGQSSVSAYLDRSAIPIREILKEQPDALKKALSDGEDFELCFTLGPEDSLRLQNDSRFDFCSAIGEIRAGSGIFWKDDHSAMDWQGFEHGGFTK